MQSDRLGRRVLRGEQRGGIGVNAPQQLLGQASRQLLAHERVPEAIAAAHALEHAGRLGLAKRLIHAFGARERRELRAREAVVDYGERGKQSLAERLEPVQPPRHHLAQPRRHGHLAGGVHRRRELLGEERVACRRALDERERAGRQRPGGGPLRDRRQRGPVEWAERQFHRRAALQKARAHERGGLGKRLVAHAGDHEQALGGAAAREVVHQRGRCLVRGVQVIDCEHQATLRGGLCEQLGDRRKDAMAVHGLLRQTLRAAHRGQESRQGSLCAVGESAGQLRAPGGERVERLHERRVRRAALFLVNGAAQRVEAKLLRLGEHGLEEAGLPDPERARHQQRAAVGGGGTPQRGRR